MEDLIRIGCVSSAHALKGELRIVPLTDTITRFQKLERVALETADELKWLQVENVRLQQNTVIMLLEGITDRISAENCRGAHLAVKQEDCPKLPQYCYYDFQLVGMTVQEEDSTILGKISEVMHTGCNEVYVVTGGKQEILLPALKSVVKRVDLSAGLMVVELPLGLVD